MDAEIAVVIRYHEWVDSFARVTGDSKFTRKTQTEISPDKFLAHHLCNSLPLGVGSLDFNFLDTLIFHSRIEECVLRMGPP